LVILHFDLCNQDNSATAVVSPEGVLREVPLVAKIVDGSEDMG
jgi:hypothetical protein